MSGSIQDLCRVSGEVAATLMRTPMRPGDVHIFKDGLHAKLTVLGNDHDFRIITGCREDRDGVPINGSLHQAVKLALDNPQTSSLAFGRKEFYRSSGSEQDNAESYLITQGTLETLNSKPILVIGDKYYNILII